VTIRLILGLMTEFIAHLYTQRVTTNSTVLSPIYIIYSSPLHTLVLSVFTNCIVTYWVGHATNKLHAVFDIADLLHIRSYTYTIYSFISTAIFSSTITYPVVSAMHSIQLTSAAATFYLARYSLCSNSLTSNWLNPHYSRNSATATIQLFS
jgi:hypothetical protein